MRWAFQLYRCIICTWNKWMGSLFVALKKWRFSLFLHLQLKITQIVITVYVPLQFSLSLLTVIYHNKILITRNAETLKVSCWLSSESGLLLENVSTAAERAGIIITLSWKISILILTLINTNFYLHWQTVWPMNPYY